jgi:hypothetical protein
MIDKKEVQINPEVVGVAQQIMEHLAQVRPEHSLSFVLNAEGVSAIDESIKIAEWGIGGNKPKLKATALEILNSISEAEPGDPVNVNFTEYEVKAMEEVLDVLGKALETHEDGLLT